MNCFIPSASCSPQYHTRSSLPEPERPQPIRAPPESMVAPVPIPKRRMKSRLLILRALIRVIPYYPLCLPLLDRHLTTAVTHNQTMLIVNDHVIRYMLSLVVTVSAIIGWVRTLVIHQQCTAPDLL